MKRVLYFVLVLTLAVALTACGGGDGGKTTADSGSDSGSTTAESGPVSGEINDSATIANNDDIKVTFKRAYYNEPDDGVLAVLEIENKLDQDISYGFYDVYINGIGFDAWQADDTISAGESGEVVYKLASTTNLKMAGVDTLSKMVLGFYYYTDENNMQSMDDILVKNSENPDYDQAVNFSGKDVKINYGSGELVMTFGMDKMIMDEEYGDAELYVMSKNDKGIPIVIYYEAVMNDGNDISLPYCGPVLYENDAYMEALPFNGGDLEKCESVTIKNLYITDFNDTELFRLDELVIKKGDVEPVSY